MPLTSNATFLGIVTFVLLVLSMSPASGKAQSVQINEEHSKAIYPELLELRRDLFRHPEMSGKEKRTSKIVADYLEDLGLEVKTNVGGYGVVGILRGSKPGKRIAWRADMDGAQFEFGNQENDEVAHVCGHDVHTTMGLGIANTLSQRVEDLAGTVYFLFQPAEENQKGAKAMIADGLLDMIQVDEIYAAHVGPMPTGAIFTTTGNLFSHSRYLNIEFAGSSDAEAITEMVNSMMTSVTRVRMPDQFTNLLNTSDPILGLGNPDTIYQKYILFDGQPRLTKSENKLTLFAELFTADQHDIALVVANLEQQIRASKYKDRFNSIQIFHEREGVDNNAELVSQAIQIFKDSYGSDVVPDNFGRVPFASEDFGHFQRTVPGVYFFIGTANAEKGNVAFPHMPDFEVDETVIHLGVSRFSTLLEHRLQTQ